MKPLSLLKNSMRAAGLCVLALGMSLAGAQADLVITPTDATSTNMPADGNWSAFGWYAKHVIDGYDTSFTDNSPGGPYGAFDKSVNLIGDMPADPWAGTWPDHSTGTGEDRFGNFEVRRDLSILGGPSPQTDGNAYVYLTLDGVYNLTGIHVWNQFSQAWRDGTAGCKNVNVATSTDNINWSSGTDLVFAQGPDPLTFGTTPYRGQNCALTPAQGQYVRLMITSDWAGDEYNAGLAEVRLIGTAAAPGGGGYTDWALHNAGSGAPGADFNNDGVPNGIAFFMGENGRATLPGVAGGQVSWHNSGNILPSEYGADKKYVVQTSLDLATWNNVPIGDLTTNTSGPTGALTYTLPTGVAGGKIFVRLVVTP